MYPHRNLACKLECGALKLCPMSCSKYAKHGREQCVFLCIEVGSTRVCVLQSGLEAFMITGYAVYHPQTYDEVVRHGAQPRRTWCTYGRAAALTREGWTQDPQRSPGRPHRLPTC